MDFSSPKALALVSDKPRWGNPSIHHDTTSISSSSAAGGWMAADSEHMFDKVVTPSDVGKLNRLVIPKQHAEKYFPLDPASGEKGLLLSFEDRTGKSWRFRYSYWNSSQSYVMTKGWSRFVKDKKLDAGDVVSFHRFAGDSGNHRFYIDWRRRRPDHHHHRAPETLNCSIPWCYSSTPYARPSFLLGQGSLPLYHGQEVVAGAAPRGNYGVIGSKSVVCLSDGASHLHRMHMRGRNYQMGSGAGVDPMVFESVPVVHGKAAAKRLRLFGVNMDCPVSGDQEEPGLSFATPTPMKVSGNVMCSSSNGALQLRFHSGNPASTTISTTSNIQAATGFLDKGKSSMSLDYI